MGYDLYLNAKAGKLHWWDTTRDSLFREFAIEFEHLGEHQPDDPDKDMIWRPHSFEDCRRWIANHERARDTYGDDTIRNLATALVLMEFDGTLWFESSW